jgi:UDP-glucose 4-epimerase
LDAGQDVLVFDNLSNSKAAVMQRITRITGKSPVFIEGDVRDATLLKKRVAKLFRMKWFQGDRVICLNTMPKLIMQKRF